MSNYLVDCGVRQFYRKAFVVLSRSEGEAINMAKKLMFKAGGTILWEKNEIFIIEVRRVG